MDLGITTVQEYVGKLQADNKPMESAAIAEPTSEMEHTS
jgi:hypothetical protein